LDLVLLSVQQFIKFYLNIFSLGSSYYRSRSFFLFISAFFERITWMPFVFLEAKSQTCHPFPIANIICKQWSNHIFGGSDSHINGYCTVQQCRTKKVSQSTDWMCLENWWAWEISWLPSNDFWLLKRALELSIQNQMSSFQSSTITLSTRNTLVKKIYFPQVAVHTA
jgi:hypothetical protein